MPQTESAFYDLKAIMPYSALERLKTAYGPAPAGTELAGLCFLPNPPKRENTPFATTSFEVILVYWNKSEDVRLSDRLVFGPTHREGDNVFSMAVDDATTTVAAGRAIPRIGSVSRRGGVSARAFSFLTPRDWAFTLFRYNGTREFDSVFLDIDTFEYLANTVVPDPPTTEERGITISRAVFTLPVETPAEGLGYYSFRTLNFSPYPYTEDRSGEATRMDVAFHLGPPCPPWWDDGIRSVSSDVSEATFRTVKSEPPFCNCPNIPPNLLFQKLLDNGFILKQAPEPLNLWPVLLIRLFLFILLLAIVVILLSQLIGIGK